MLWGYLSRIPEVVVPLPPEEARIVDLAANDPRIEAEPLLQHPALWRVSVCGVQLAPVGDLTLQRDGVTGFGGRWAALTAGWEALHRMEQRQAA